MARGAKMGNQNARGPHDKGGIRAGLVGGMFGPGGTLLSGAYLGATGRSQKALTRHSVTSAVMGGAVGTAVMPVLGTAVGAGLSYGFAKGGQALGKRIYDANHNNVNPNRSIKHREHAPHIKAHAARGPAK